MPERYVPAAGRAGLTRLYDPVMALTMREGTWRPALLEAVSADLPDGGTVIDVGAGTGTFVAALVRARSDARVVGVDGDEEALAIGRAKAPGASFARGLADALPIGDGGADVVTMSLLLHHLGTEAKGAALREAHRALRPGGALHVADWGRPSDPLMRTAFLGLQLLDGFPNTRDHAAGRLAELIERAGFAPVRTSHRLRTGFGTLELLSAKRP